MNSIRRVLTPAVFWIAVVACADGRPEGWTDSTHGKDTAPNYDLLFSTNEVHTIELSIAPSDFQAMQDDLAELLGSGGLPGGGGGGFPGGGPAPEMIAACDGLTEAAACNFTSMFGSLEGTCEALNDSLACIPGGGGPGGGGPGGGADLVSRDPIYVPIELRYDGHTWSHVGMRYKGNSSLAGGYSSENAKLAFRLDLDEFENDFPVIEDQRFYGFKKLTFSSNWNDDSLVRELYVNELLRDRGMPAARCAFYRVFVDVGAGSQYWGVYTMIEDPADGAMLDSQLAGRDGNLYKPEGVGADWTAFDQAGFEKKTNEEAADWSDVQAAIEALHADNTSDPAAWRAAFEATFDVDLFLTWLAVNTTVVNWDVYGAIAHNYYLYAPPGERQLRWIPWDHNLSMMAGFGPGGPAPGGETDAVSEIFHANVSSNWPLISRLISDPVYKERYREKLEHALLGLFEVEAATARMRELHELVRPYAVGPEGEQPGYTNLSSEQAFLDAIDGLEAHVRARHARVEEALAQ